MGNAESKEMHSGRESGYKGHDARTALGYNPGHQSGIYRFVSAHHAAESRDGGSVQLGSLFTFFGLCCSRSSWASDLPYWLVLLQRLFRAEALELAHRRLWDLCAVELQDSGWG